MGYGIFFQLEWSSSEDQDRKTKAPIAFKGSKARTSYHQSANEDEQKIAHSNRPPSAVNRVQGDTFHSLHCKSETIYNKKDDQKITSNLSVEQGDMVTPVQNRRVMTGKDAPFQRNDNRGRHTYDNKSRARKYRTGISSLKHTGNENCAVPLTISGYLKPSRQLQPNSSSRKKASSKTSLSVPPEDVKNCFPISLELGHPNQPLIPAVPEGKAPFLDAEHSLLSRNEKKSCPVTYISSGEGAGNQATNKHQPNMNLRCGVELEINGYPPTSERIKARAKSSHDEAFEFTADKENLKEPCKKGRGKEGKGSQSLCSVSVQTGGSFTFEDRDHGVRSIGIGTGDTQCGKGVYEKKRTQEENGALQSKEWVPYTDGRIKLHMDRYSEEQFLGETPRTHIPNHSGKAPDLKSRKVLSDVQVYNPPVEVAQSPPQR